MRKEKQTNKQTTDVKEKAKTQSKGKHGYGAVAAVVIAVGAVGLCCLPDGTEAVCAQKGAGSRGCRCGSNSGECAGNDGRRKRRK